MRKIAVFAGSFDPFTLGHQDIVQRALPLFDQIVIAMGVHSQKRYGFDAAKRLAGMEHLFKNQPKIKIISYKGLTADFCKKVKASCLLRGLRNTVDFEYEKNVAQFNENKSGIPTLFLMANPAYSHISSSLVREIIKNNGDIKALLPQEISEYIK